MDESMDVTAPPDEFGPLNGDAFGALLIECWASGGEPGSVLEFIERDDGYLDACDAARYFATSMDCGVLGR